MEREIDPATGPSQAFIDGLVRDTRCRVLDEVERRLPEPRGAFDWGLGYHVALEDVRRVLRAMRDGGGD